MGLLWHWIRIWRQQHVPTHFLAKYQVTLPPSFQPTDLAKYLLAEALKCVFF